MQFLFDLNVPRPAFLRSARSKLSRFEQCRLFLDLYLLDPNSANSSVCWAGVVPGIRSTWPNMDHRCCFTLTDSGTTLHILYEASLEITLCGHASIITNHLFNKKNIYLISFPTLASLHAVRYPVAAHALIWTFLTQHWIFAPLNSFE